MEALQFTKREKQKLIKELTTQINNCKRPSDLKLEYSFKDKLFKNIKKPTVYIDPKAYLKMFALVKESPVEISWHGFVKRINKNTYYIYDIIVFPQINSATATETDETEYIKWISEMMKKDNFEEMRMHGHSHVNMSVFSSGIDNAYQNDLIKNIKPGDYYIFLVLNKKHEIEPLVFDYSKNILFTGDEVTIKIGLPTETTIDDWAKTIIKLYCKTKKYPNYTNSKYLRDTYFEKYGGIYDGLE